MYAQKIVDGLYCIKIKFVNTFLLVSNEGCVLVDTGIPGGTEVILKALEELEMQPTDIRHIILTHAHPDHIGSAGALKKATGAEVYIHEKDAPIATKGKGFRIDNFQISPGFVNKFIARFLLGKTKEVDPVEIDHILEDGQVLLGGLK